MKTQVVSEPFKIQKLLWVGAYLIALWKPLERWRGEEVGEVHIKINQDKYEHGLFFFSPSPHHVQLLPSGLIGYWKCEENCFSACKDIKLKHYVSKKYVLKVLSAPPLCTRFLPFLWIMIFFLLVQFSLSVGGWLVDCLLGNAVTSQAVQIKRSLWENMFEKVWHLSNVCLCFWEWISFNVVYPDRKSCSV